MNGSGESISALCEHLSQCSMRAKIAVDLPCNLTTGLEM